MFREQHICKKVKSHISTKANKSLHTHKLSKKKEKKKRVYTQKFAYITGKTKHVTGGDSSSQTVAKDFPLSLSLVRLCFHLTDGHSTV